MNKTFKCVSIQKFICTTIRPTQLEYRELYDWDGAAEFVADYLNFETLEPPYELVSSTNMGQPLYNAMFGSHWNTPCYKIESLHDKTNKMTIASSEDSNQPGHPPSLMRVFAVSMKKHWVLSYPLSAQQRLWSVWVDAGWSVFAGPTCQFVGLSCGSSSETLLRDNFTK